MFADLLKLSSCLQPKEPVRPILMIISDDETEEESEQTSEEEQSEHEMASQHEATDGAKTEDEELTPVKGCPDSPHHLFLPDEDAYVTPSRNWSLRKELFGSSESNDVDGGDDDVGRKGEDEEDDEKEDTYDELIDPANDDERMGETLPNISARRTGIQARDHHVENSSRDPPL